MEYPTRFRLGVYNLITRGNRAPMKRVGRIMTAEANKNLEKKIKFREPGKTKSAGLYWRQPGND